MSKTFKFTDGDVVRLDDNKGYEYVEGRAKIKQDVECIISTSTRTSTGLGCQLSDTLGKDTMDYSSAFTQFPAVFDFQTSLYIGLNRLKGAQNSYQYDIRTPDELIFDFAPVQVWYSDQDPRSYEWEISVYTIDGKDGFTVGGGF